MGEPMGPFFGILILAVLWAVNNLTPTPLFADVAIEALQDHVGSTSGKSPCVDSSGRYCYRKAHFALPILGPSPETIVDECIALLATVENLREWSTQAD